MALVNRNFTYKRRIKVSTDDLALTKSGRKVCTIRLGTAAVGGEVMELSDGHETLPIKIVSVVTERFGNLTQEHAQWEGFSSVDELRKDLEKYYRRIDENQPVTIIKFDLINT